MELTNEQALQQAVEAHKAGKLQDAEALYRAILQAQPKHPDANHNLGVLAVSLNKSELALPLFKTALEANPSQGQFWLSYIDALIKTNQLEIAKGVLEQGKKLGLAGESVDALEVQLTPIAVVEESESILQKQASSFSEQRKRVSAKKEKKKNSPSNQTNTNQVRSPSQAEVSGLLEHYQKGRYDLAENLAKKLTQQYPDHQFSWKVLGAVFKQTGRLQESLIASQRAVAILPNDAEAHYNLGNTLKGLGRLKDAEASFSKAILIKPEYAQAHSNLGNTLKGLGRLKDAEASFSKAITIKPDLAEAHYNLGNTLKEIGRLEEAETSYKKAITIKPDYAEAYYNLGATLQELCRLRDAEENYSKAILIKPDYAQAHSNLGATLQELGRLEDAETSYKKAIAINPEYAQAHSNLGATLQELGRLEDAETSYKKAIAINPDLAEAHSNLGAILQELGRLEDAEKSYSKAIAINPDLAEAHSNLGLLLMQKGDLEGSRNMHERAIKLDSKKWNNYYNYSTYLYETGHTDSAIDCIKRAQFIAPKNKFKLVEICFKAISADKVATEAKANETYKLGTNLKFGLRSDPLILNRPVENELIAYLCQMNSRILDKTIDARYGNGKCSTDFELFNDESKIIKVIAQDLTKICRDAVASEVYIYDSFFNIYGAGAGTKVHNHINSNDKFFGLSKRKYSLVYYLDVGDQSGIEPGVLRLFNPDQDIMPLNGMIVIINANKKHNALYDGKKDRIMIGVNFYSI
jgi:tetratricopeptide (TPR) repeat protein